MDFEAAETFSTGVIGRNKDSPFQILDVRSINGASSSIYNLHATEDTGALSDASSGSEKQLVIDMADEEDSDPKADEPETRPVKPSEKKEGACKETTVAEVRKVRVSRRKSQHVPIATEDVVFGVPSTEPNAKVEELLSRGKHMEKHLLQLRETINHILEQRYGRNFNFAAASKGKSRLAQLRMWTNCYEIIKKKSAAEKASQEAEHSQ